MDTQRRELAKKYGSATKTQKVMMGEVTCESHINVVMGGTADCGSVGNVDQAAA